MSVDQSIPEFDPAWLESEDAWEDFEEEQSDDLPEGLEPADEN